MIKKNESSVLILTRSLLPSPDQSERHSSLDARLENWQGSRGLFLVKGKTPLRLGLQRCYLLS